MIKLYTNKLEEENKLLNHKLIQLEEELSSPYYKLARHYKFRPKLCNILKNKDPYKIVQGVRQSGKTTLSWSLALIRALEKKTSIVIVNCSDRMVKVTFDGIVGALDNGVLYYDYILRRVNQSTIMFKNGSSIMIENRITPQFLQGFRFDVLIIDEMSDTDQNVIEYVNQYGFQNFNEALIVSTTTRANLFFSWWDNAVHGTNTFTPFSISMEESHTPERIKEIYKIFAEKDIIAEYTLRK